MLPAWKASIFLLVAVATVAACEQDDVLSLLQSKAFYVRDADDDESNWIAKSKASTVQSKSNDVLYIVKTYSGNYDSKLQAVMQTWGSQVDPDSLVIIGDKPSATYPVHAVPECGNGDIDEQLSCRVASGLVLAAQHPGNWKWVLLIDDDHYVVEENIKRMLATWDNLTGPVAFGAWGCGQTPNPPNCHGRGGFCGGSGYGFNRKAIQMMVRNSPEEFKAAHQAMVLSPVSDPREDMATSCLATERIPNLRIEAWPPRWSNRDCDSQAWGDLEQRGSCGLDVLLHHCEPRDLFRLQQIYGGPERDCAAEND